MYYSQQHHVTIIAPPCKTILPRRVRLQNNCIPNFRPDLPRQLPPNSTNIWWVDGSVTKNRMLPACSFDIPLIPFLLYVNAPNLKFDLFVLSERFSWGWHNSFPVWLLVWQAKKSRSEIVCGKVRKIDSNEVDRSNSRKTVLLVVREGGVP